MIFDWCEAGQHGQCERRYQRFVIEPNRKRGEPSVKLVYLDEFVECSCTKRNCPCYTPPSQRMAKPRRRKK